MSHPESTTRSQVATVVYSTITEILPDVPPSEITGEEHLEDLGADSVDRVEIILGILQRLRLEEPMASFSQLKNVNALIDFLCERKAQ